MKQNTLFFAVFAVLSGMVSCVKKVDNIHSCTNGVYSKWQVNTINAKSYVFPAGLVWDTTYAALPSDYIDLSAKGIINFSINGLSHIDTYDTAKYDLEKDTSIPVNITGKLGSSHVSLSGISNNSITLKEATFEIDTESETDYNLER